MSQQQSTSHGILTCTVCDNDIVPGDKRTPTTTGTAHEFCDLAREAASHYSMFTGTHNGFDVWSLFYDHGDFEAPIAFNTGAGFVTYSGCKATGDQSSRINLDERFVKAVAYSHHWVKCYMKVKREDIKKRVEREYGDETTAALVDAVMAVVNRLHHSPAVYEELGPLAEAADAVTAWGTPETMTQADLEEMYEATRPANDEEGSVETPYSYKLENLDGPNAYRLFLYYEGDNYSIPMTATTADTIATASALDIHSKKSDRTRLSTTFYDAVGNVAETVRTVDDPHPERLVQVARNAYSSTPSDQKAILAFELGARIASSAMVAEEMAPIIEYLSERVEIDLPDVGEEYIPREDN